MSKGLRHLYEPINVGVGVARYYIKPQLVEDSCTGCAFVNDRAMLCSGTIVFRIPQEYKVEGLFGCQMPKHILIEDDTQSIFNYLASYESGLVVVDEVGVIDIRDDEFNNAENLT